MPFLELAALQSFVTGGLGKIFSAKFSQPLKYHLDQRTEKFRSLTEISDTLLDGDYAFYLSQTFKKAYVYSLLTLTDRFIASVTAEYVPSKESESSFFGSLKTSVQKKFFNSHPDLNHPYNRYAPVLEYFKSLADDPISLEATNSYLKDPMLVLRDNPAISSNDSTTEAFREEVYSFLRSLEQRKEFTVDVAREISTYFITEDRWFNEFTETFGVFVSRNQGIRDTFQMHLLRALTEEVSADVSPIELENFRLALAEDFASLSSRLDFISTDLYRLGISLTKLPESTPTSYELRRYRSDLSKHFYGRTSTLNQISGFIDGNRRGILKLYAPPGYGKSTVLSEWVHANESKYLIADYFFSTTRDWTRYLHAYKRIAALLDTQLGERLRGLSGDAAPNLTIRTDDDYRVYVYEVLRSLKHLKLDRPLVIVLDALDESEILSLSTGLEYDFNFPLPPADDFPEGLYLIFSVREEEDGQLKSISRFLDRFQALKPQSLALGTLTESDISEWINTEINSKFRTEFAVKPNLRKSLTDGLSTTGTYHEIFEKTGGVPLYATHLIYDVLDIIPNTLFNEDTAIALRKALASTPTTLNQYLEDRLISIMSTADYHGHREIEKYRELLFLLINAVGPINKHTLQGLLGVDRAFFRVIPSFISRWISVTQPYENFPDSDLYSLYNKNIADPFKKAAEYYYASDTTRMNQSLLNLCASWEQLKGLSNDSEVLQLEYILRNYADHLAQNYFADRNSNAIDRVSTILTNQRPRKKH